MVPPVDAKTKVVMPHAIFVMDIVDRHFHPEALAGVFVLELVSVSGKGGIGNGPTRPAKTTGKGRSHCPRYSREIPKQRLDLHYDGGDHDGAYRPWGMHASVDAANIQRSSQTQRLRQS